MVLRIWCGLLPWLHGGWPSYINMVLRLFQHLRATLALSQTLGGHLKILFLLKQSMVLDGYQNFHERTLHSAKSTKQLTKQQKFLQVFYIVEVIVLGGRWRCGLFLLHLQSSNFACLRTNFKTSKKPKNHN